MSQPVYIQAEEALHLRWQDRHPTYWHVHRKRAGGSLKKHHRDNTDTACHLNWISLDALLQRRAYVSVAWPYKALFASVCVSQASRAILDAHRACRPLSTAPGVQWELEYMVFCVTSEGVRWQVSGTEYQVFQTAAQIRCQINGRGKIRKLTA